jgi:hypothetical protein
VFSIAWRAHRGAVHSCHVHVCSVRSRALTPIAILPHRGLGVLQPRQRVQDTFPRVLLHPLLVQAPVRSRCGRRVRRGEPDADRGRDEVGRGCVDRGWRNARVSDVRQRGTDSGLYGLCESNLRWATARRRELPARRDVQSTRRLVKRIVLIFLHLVGGCPWDRPSAAKSAARWRMPPERASARCPEIGGIQSGAGSRLYSAGTFSTSLKAYICRAVLLDVHIGSISFTWSNASVSV